jgi:hypothetical protein
MNKTIFQLGILLQLGVGLFLFSLLFVPHTSKAVSVSANYTDNWIYYQYFNKGGCRATWGDFKAWTQFYMSLSKSFDLNSSSLGNLNQNESRVIRPGETITGLNTPITGSYNYASGDYGTPPMDDQVYNWNYTSGKGACNTQYSVLNQMKAGIHDQLGYQLSSSDNNIIDCSNGQSCVAKSQNGTATITVSFPGTGYYYVQRIFQFGWYGINYSNVAATQVRPTNCGRGCSYYYVCPAGYSLKSTVGSRGGGLYCQSPGTPYFKSEGNGGVAQNFSYTLNSLSYNVTVQQPNEAPTVSNVRVEKIGKGYTEAVVKWDYNDIEGDAQTLAQIQIVTDTGVVVYNGSTGVDKEKSLTGETAVTGMHPGVNYYAKVRAVDAYNQINSATWVNSGVFQMTNYPALTIDYKINNIDSRNVTVRTADNVNAVWNISDADGGVVDGLAGTCNITAVGFDAINGTGLPLMSNRSYSAPRVAIDKTYNVNLTCAAKPGGIAVNETITLVVESYPVISCSISKNVVSTNSPTAEILANIDNAIAPYTWWVKNNIADSYGVSITNSLTTQKFTLNYTGIGVGKYTPVIQAKGTGGRTAEKVCTGGITNFGDRAISEVAP